MSQIAETLGCQVEVFGYESMNLVGTLMTPAIAELS